MGNILQDACYSEVIFIVDVESFSQFSEPKYFAAISSVITSEFGSDRALAGSPCNRGKVNISKKSGSARQI